MDVIVGRTYKHFKGHIYKVLMIATDADCIDRKLVIYENVLDKKIWARKYEEFISKVDKIKYPDVKQTYRFELYD